MNDTKTIERKDETVKLSDIKTGMRLEALHPTKPKYHSVKVLGRVIGESDMFWVIVQYPNGIAKKGIRYAAELRKPN